MSALLQQLRESPEFQAVMSDALRTRPVVADYRPMNTIDETTNAIEQIKYSMAQRAGFDLLYSVLMGRKPD